MKMGIIVVVLWSVLAGAGLAQEPSAALSADEIVKRANHMALYQGADARGRVSMVITDGQGRTRKREFNMLRKNDDDRDGDQKYYAFFKAPADVRKMVFMVHKHAAPDKDDDRWLYMPGLDLVKRIAAGDKRTSFVGSDFLYEDISGRGPAEDEHELIRSTDAHYVIKNIPKKPRDVEFDYYIAHIDKKTFMPMKMEFFKSGGRRYRVIESLTMEPIRAEENGARVIYPTVTLSVARDLATGGETRMAVSDIRYNTGLGDRMFTERYLRRPPRDAMR